MTSIPRIIFEDALGKAAVETEALLDRLLDPAEAPARRLVEAMRYSTLGGGKRVRPFLVIEAAGLFGVPGRQALRVGAALECVHCYSLAHDDLPAMDDDDFRRGRPSLHKAFDEASAILAGDALLTFAFEILADSETHPDGHVRATLAGDLARAAGMNGMAGGQMLDLEPLDARHELAALMRMQSMKTGALFRFACAAGAILGAGERAPLERYGESIGLAFQIADDILDIESSAASLGKATQKDKARGKATFIDLLGLDGAKKRAAALVEEGLDALSAFGDSADALRELARFVVNRRK